MGCGNSKPSQYQLNKKERNQKANQFTRKLENNTASFWDTQSQNIGLDLKNNDEKTISSVENIYYYYQFLKKLGNGSFGSVMLAQSIKDPQQKVAIKVINKKGVEGTPSFYLKREVDIIRQLDHPNICRFLETYMDKDNIYLVMEYCSGGTLKDKFVNKVQLTEYEISQVMKKLFWAVNYLHTKNIVHRDLKLENVVYDSNDPNAEIKIIDFGLSKKLGNKTNKKRHTIVGSAFYMAPEVLLHEKYERECDIWSLGVMMYYLLSRELPFEDLNQIQQGNFNFESPVWEYVSKEAKDLIKNILLVDTKKRLTLDKALEHKWFKIMKEQNNLKIQQKSLPVRSRTFCSIMEKLISFRMDNLVKKEFLMIYVKRMSNNENLTPKRVFQNIDKDQNGIITPDDLRGALQEMGITDIQNIDELMVKICGSKKKEAIQQKRNGNNNYISYSEFIAATLDENTYLNKLKLQIMFNYLNTTQTSYLTAQDIVEVMAKEGRKLSDQKLQSFLKELEQYASEPGKIYFEDFCRIMGYRQFDMEIIDGYAIKLKTLSSNKNNSSKKTSDQIQL